MGNTVARMEEATPEVVDEAEVRARQSQSVMQQGTIQVHVLL